MPGVGVASQPSRPWQQNDSARLDPGNPLASFMSPEVLDRFGLCAVCGRREDCCAECHRGHDWAWGHPQWSIAQRPHKGGDKIFPARELAKAFQTEVGR